MDLVDEEHVVALQVREDGGEILGLFQHPGRRSGAGSRPSSWAMMWLSVVLPGPAAEQQHVVQRLRTLLRAPMKISSCSRALAWPT
jgi:hypothetical protein